MRQQPSKELDPSGTQEIPQHLDKPVSEETPRTEVYKIMVSDHDVERADDLSQDAEVEEVARLICEAFEIIAVKEGFILVSKDSDIDDVELEPVPNLATEAGEGSQGVLQEIAKAARGAVVMRALSTVPLFVPAVIMASGCATMTRQINRMTSSHGAVARDYYREGNYLEVMRQLKRIPEEKMTEAEKELLAKVERAIKEKLKLFLGQTTHFEGNSVMQNNYPEAVEYYELAYKHMLENNPFKKSVKKRIDDLKKLIDKLEKDYAVAEQKIDLLLEKDDLMKDNLYLKLAAAIHTLQQIAPQLNMNNKSRLTALCIDIANRLKSKDKHKAAMLYFEMAKQINGKVIPGEQNKDNLGTATADYQEALRELAVQELKKDTEEFIKVHSEGKNAKDRKRMVELAYEIAENLLSVEVVEDLLADGLIKDKDVLEWAKKVKGQDEARRSKWQRDQRRKQRDKKRKEKDAERRAEDERISKELAAKAEAAATAKPEKPAKKELTQVQKNQIEKLLGNADNFFPSKASYDLWKKVLKMDPGNEEAKAGIERYKEYEKIKNSQNGNGH